MLAGFPLGFPNAMETPTLIALLHGPDQPGLVARVSGWIFARGGNILHADQHRDREAGIFFQRIEWVPTGAAGVAEREAADFLAFAASLGMQAKVILSSRRARIAVFVSKADHCFHDLILRWKAGDFSGDIVAIVGNHTDLAEAARGYGVPFHAIPVTADTKPQAEARQLALLNEVGHDPRLTLILFTLDESAYARELAPLAGHYPAVRLGPPWWFHDSIEGMRRFREQTTETAGLYNTAGFNDDTRAFCSIPARHDLSRRMDANFLGGLVARHIIDLNDAQVLGHALAYDLARRTYRFDAPSAASPHTLREAR